MTLSPKDLRRGPGFKLTNSNEPDLEKRLKVCIASGLIESANYLALKGGKAKILNVGAEYLEDEKAKLEVSEIMDKHLSEQGLKSCLSKKGKAIN